MQLPQRVSRFGSAFLQSLLAFIYPQSCLICENPLAETERHVCGRCWRNFDRFEPEKQQLDVPENITRIFSLWPFDESIQKIVHEVKYRRMVSLGTRVGQELGDCLREDLDFAGADFIVPVPLHKTRLRERGYNQSLVIAGPIAESLGLDLRPELLIRARPTKSQTKLNAEERSRNLHGAFEVTNSEVVQNKTVILVDDVATTGATLAECARVLQVSGVPKVLAITAARTL